MNRSALLLLFLIAFQGCAPEDGQDVRLVILISVDQMRGDYLDRHGEEFTGGFQELRTKGVHFTNADLNYASSETGPGHATLATGTYPRKNGIHGNEWIDPVSKRAVYCVADDSAQAIDGNGGFRSAKNLVTTSLGDWLKMSFPRSKVVSVSVKDRGAILMGGKRPDYVYWYDRKTGRMVTSSYYGNRTPSWVREFNGSGWMDKNVPESWTKLYADDYYGAIGGDDAPGESSRDGSSSFPHTLTGEDRFDRILTSPFGDRMILDLAVEAMKFEKMGRGIVPDLLCISLSCTDYIGHSYGPDSHEMHDNLLRLDQNLGVFFDKVRLFLGHDRFVIALSADHGVMPLPEFLVSKGEMNAKRVNPGRILHAIDSINKALAGFGDGVRFVEPTGFIDYSAGQQHGFDSLTLERLIMAGMLRQRETVEVYPRRLLLQEPTDSESHLDKFRRSYYAPRGEDLQAEFCSLCLVSSHDVGTTHGSVHDYDTHVPIVIMGAGIQPMRIERRAYLVDVAPTLATILKIQYPQTVDGKPLNDVVASFTSH